MKRVCVEVECDVCGKKFVQSRWWQMYCSKKCATTRKHYNGGEIYRLRSRITELEAEIEELKNPTRAIIDEWDGIDKEGVSNAFSGNARSGISLWPSMPYWKQPAPQINMQALQGEEDQSTKWGE